MLGLVIEQPGLSAKAAGPILSQRFASARFHPTAAHGALKQLSKDELVDCTYRAPGRRRSLDEFQANQGGLKVFRAWMYDIPEDGELEGGARLGGKPSIREAMYGRIELCRPEELPRLIELAQSEQKVSAALFTEASAKLRRHLESRYDPLDFRRKIREVVLHVDPSHWSERSLRWAQVAGRLEEIQKEIEAVARLEAGGG